jgi:hypothetical protein
MQNISSSYLEKLKARLPYPQDYKTTLSDPAGAAAAVQTNLLAHAALTSNAHKAVRVVTATTTELATDLTIICNKAWEMTVNLLAATGSGRILRIKNINTGVVTVDPAGVETIDGETTQTVEQYDCLEIVDHAIGAWVIT